LQTVVSNKDHIYNAGLEKRRNVVTSEAFAYYAILNYLTSKYFTKLRTPHRRPTTYSRCLGLSPFWLVAVLTRPFLSPFQCRHWVCLKTDKTTGQDGAFLPQLVAISSPWWRDGVDDGTLPINETLIVGTTGQT